MTLDVVGPVTANPRQHGGVIELDLKQGEKAMFYSGKMPDDFVIAPYSHSSKECNL